MTLRKTCTIHPSQDRRLWCRLAVTASGLHLREAMAIKDTADASDVSVGEARRNGKDAEPPCGEGVLACGRGRAGSFDATREAFVRCGFGHPACGIVECLEANAVSEGGTESTRVWWRRMRERLRGRT